jgi:putative ABC transport system permease protein
LSLTSFHTGSGSVCCLAIPGYTPCSNDDLTVAQNLVTPRYFETMGIPVLRGRDFLPSEVQLHPAVAVINQAAATKYFRNQDPIAKRVRLSVQNEEYRLEIVGLVKDAKFDSLREEPEPMLYLPSPRGLAPPFIPTFCLELRTFGVPGAFTAAIRNTARSVNQDLKVASIDTLTDIVDRTLVQERLIGKLSSFLACWRSC